MDTGILRFLSSNPNSLGIFSMKCTQMLYGDEIILMNIHMKCTTSIGNLNALLKGADKITVLFVVIAYVGSSSICCMLYLVCVDW